MGIIQKVMGFNSKEYWETRYKQNGTSGSGSYGRLCDFKAKIINEFIVKNYVKNVAEFGCGDGNQLSKFRCYGYTGYDVSESIINKNIERFKSDHFKTFKMYDKYDGEKYDLSLSLDVIFHLVEDDVFEEYMNKLFDSSKKYVIIYSSNGQTTIKLSEHLKDRKFTDWVYDKKPNFKLIEKIDNPYPFIESDPSNTSMSDFYIFQNVLQT